VITVDASAVIAILFQEPEALQFTSVIARAGGGTMSPVNYWEVIVRTMATHGSKAKDVVDALLDVLGVEIPTCDRSDAVQASAAFQRYGKGRNPARLNLGDCFAYALAGRQGKGLLFKGDDFPRTDVVRVPV
jgi:ribonuclease VapC